MFQRLKGAIDSRIAEEQARQKTVATPIPRSASNARRSSSRTDSPSSKARRGRPKEDGAPARGPDPSEFETAFVIEDESEEPSRVGTPVVGGDKAVSMGENNDAATAEESSEKGGEKATLELPTEVRTKLRKLEKLESKYQELLRSYRIAHARAISIEPFEKTLKENTPLSTISDPDALVEYLSQLNLKGDMVMDELKRVSADRDEYKKKFEGAEKEVATFREELEIRKGSSGDDVAADTASIDTPQASVKSPVSSVLGLFSPKQKPQVTADNKDVKEEFFSYDDEVPKLQTEIMEKTAEVEELKIKISSMEQELATAQESSSGLVESLENVTRELSETKEAATRERQVRQEKLDAQTVEIETLTKTLETKEERVILLEADLAKLKNEAGKRISTLEADITTQKETWGAKLDSQLKEMEQSKATFLKRIQDLSDEVKLQSQQIEEAANQEPEDIAKNSSTTEAPTVTPASGPKKKNKKKKRSANVVASAANEQTVEHAALPASNVVAATDLEKEISKLKNEVADRDAQIAKLQTKRKTEEDLREELENMQDNFLNIGQEHVEAKDRIKELQSERTALQEKITKLEQEIESYKTQSKNSEKVEADFEFLTAEYEELKSKSATLQVDLGAAQQLATSRYKDLTELRNVLQKAQPELKTLRAENNTLKATKDELNTVTSELRRLEAREKDLKSDMALFKKQAADRENEVRSLNEKLNHETNSRLKLEDQNRVAQRDLRKSEAQKIQISASLEKSASELAQVQEEVSKLRPKVRDLEEQVHNLNSESKGLKEEVELRGSQYNNAQGLLGSMRDQAGEMAMQLKEKKEQSESLEEELAEVQRLLSERTREAETMRRLLADVDDRADAKVREMRERMEAAIEERNRAEDEASTNGRRRAREVDELKIKIRDFERDLKRTTDDKDDLARSEKEWKRRLDELERSTETEKRETSEIRAAMGELRAALDGSEKQVRDTDKQRADLRRMLDDANQRYEKLQKEQKVLQAKLSRFGDASSRSSMDSGRAGSSPVNESAGVQAGKMDYVYLKTILLQFLEQKDKKRQADLVKTVLGQLLQFDKKDQDKWIAAISAK